MLIWLTTTGVENSIDQNRKRLWHFAPSPRVHVPTGLYQSSKVVTYDVYADSTLNWVGKGVGRGGGLKWKLLIELTSVPLKSFAMKATIAIITELICLKIARIPIISTSWMAEAQTSTTTYVF